MDGKVTQMSHAILNAVQPVKLREDRLVIVIGLGVFALALASPRSVSRREDSRL
jgi:hypothetical protein